MKILTKKLQTSLVKSIYLHIPFCGIVCPFCPFTVKRDRLNLHEKYMNELRLEKRNVSREVVIEYVKSLAPAQLMYVINYDKRGYSNNF